MRTANPALNDKTFARAWESGGDMTIMGTVGKTAILLVIALAAATFTWARYFELGPASVNGLLLIGAIGGLIVAIITIFKPTFAPIGAPLYAALEGLMLGAISAMYEQRFQGLPMQAAALTFFTLAALLFAYRSGMIRATENFKLGIVAATGAIMLFYLAAMVMGMFGVRMPLLHDSSPLGIGLSAVIVVVAALNLVLDFDFIENGAERGAPKYMEWYAAFGHAHLALPGDPAPPRQAALSLAASLGRKRRGGRRRRPPLSISPPLRRSAPHRRCAPRRSRRSAQRSAAAGRA